MIIFALLTDFHYTIILIIHLISEIQWKWADIRAVFLILYNNILSILISKLFIYFLTKIKGYVQAIFKLIYILNLILMVKIIIMWTLILYVDHWSLTDFIKLLHLNFLEWQIFWILMVYIDIASNQKFFIYHIMFFLLLRIKYKVWILIFLFYFTQCIIMLSDYLISKIAFLKCILVSRVLAKLFI